MPARLPYPRCTDTFCRNIVMVAFYLLGAAMTAAVSTAGDYVTGLCRLPWIRALADNATHGLIAFLCWLMVSGQPLRKASLLDSLLSGLFGCAVDVDHFVAARSLKIENATNLKTRPFLHCSSVVLVSLSVVALLGKLLGLSQVYKVALIAFVAVASHHLRDSIRRGLWLWPFGSTSPLKLHIYYIGLACTVLIAMAAMKQVPQQRSTAGIPLVRIV
ncbi:transmembrane protein 267 [Rhipicephalus sanguineus]|uniref:transmembrane protein 267 n=1 Tax=Rhipicephalus sanguineus TaxID=34632 RepID=UPI0018955AA7|nr:transmembrane protein 267 [Rhipicephalus sanguineus]